MAGIVPLFQILKELEERNVPGKILTTNYLNFSEPKALQKLNEYGNIEIRMYDVDAAEEGFHTKGYIFKKDEIYRIIIGSSNITSLALTSNKEWNTKIVSTEQGEVAGEIVAEFNELWNSEYSLSFDAFYENYTQTYKLIKEQREIARASEVTSIESYKLKPNSMQVGFITNLKKIVDSGENRALLISATGTGKTYASAFAMRELRFKRVLFLVHRGQLARQTKKSYERVFGNTITTIEYDYPTFHLSMDCFWCEVESGELKLLEAEAAKWLSKDELDSVEWLPADITLIDQIRQAM